MLRSPMMATLLVLLVLAGCTAAGESPITGDVEGTPNGHISSMVSDPGAGTFCWGMWEVSIDPVEGTYEIRPVRDAEFMVNVVMFLQPPAGNLNNLILRKMMVDMTSEPGYIIVDVDVGLKHPFPGLMRYTGFDVRGVFMQNGQYISELDAMLTYGGPETARQMNPDGYTRWMNAMEFTQQGVLGFTEGRAGTPGLIPTATLNPYKYFTDGLTEVDDLTTWLHDPDNQMERGHFQPGYVNFRHYQLIWPEGPLDFQYAVVASYDEPTQNPPRVIPDDFPISANCAEPFHLVVTDNGSTAFYTDPDTYGGDLHLNLEVFDWGVLGHGGTIVDEIGEVSFESPGSIIPTPVTFDASTLVAKPGTSVSSVFEVDIAGVEPSGQEDQLVLCRVTSAIHDSYDYGFGVPVPDATLAAYTMFDAPVKTETPEGPVAIASACTCLWIAPGESVTFSGAQSYSPNGDIVEWRWDFDGNGTFGDPHTGTDVNPTYTYTTDGEYIVNLQVRDVLGAADTLDPAERLTVHVGTFTPPTANAYICPTIGFINFEGDFEGSGSTGVIDLYEWDFDGDCIWDYEHPTIGDTTHAYDVADIYSAILRVTGTGCDIDATEVRMIDPLPIIENGNFWDGDWDPWIHGHGGSYGNKTETIEPEDIFKWKVHFLRTGSNNDGSICYARQTLDYDVTEYDELYFNFFFYIVSATLQGDGWMSGEMDMAVRIVYDDGTGTPPYWKQAWFGYDMFTSDPGNQWQWDLSTPWYVTYHQQEKVPGQTWLERKTPDLMAILDPPPIELKWVRIDTSGWDWNTYFALPWFSEE